MYQITKGYKQGRAVSFYDLCSTTGELVKEKVEKEKVVELCGEGEIMNAKIQWWEGKAIVRLADKNIPLVKLDGEGNITGDAQRSVRNSTGIKSAYSEKPEVIKDVSANGKVVGKLNPRKASKKEISYAGYNAKSLEEQASIKAGVDFSVFNTVGDMVEAMMTEFKLSDTETYKKEIAKKVKLDRQLSSMNKMSINAIASSLAIYCMNMATEEINNTYLKYFIR